MNNTLKNIIKYCLHKKENITIKETAAALQVSESTIGNYMRSLLATGAVKVTRVKPINYKIVPAQERINDAEQCLLVYKSECLVGYLYVTNSNYCFVYDLTYLAEPEITAIFPLFPLKTEIFIEKILFPAFSQILPEGHDRHLLEIKMGTADDFSLLVELQHNYGDLSFKECSTLLPKFIKTTSPIHKSWYSKEIKQAILGEHDFPNVLNLPIAIEPNTLFPESTDLKSASGNYAPSGLSGFQHKLSIVLANGQIRQPLKNESSEYFIKPYHKEKANVNSPFYFPHLALNEHLFMSFAKNELGFDVPWSGIVKGIKDEEYHYVVKRYDRYGAVKLAHTEFAPLLGLTSENKYKISTERMCKIIKPHLPKMKERLILLKYLFYSTLIVHEDMHTKNLSIMQEGGENRMAPLYDIACTGIYQNAYGYETHLTINGQRTQIRPKHFYHLANLLGVHQEKFQYCAKKILEKYTHDLPIYFEKLALLPKAKIIFKTQANISGQTQRILSTVTLQEALTTRHKKRIDSLIKTNWYHELNLTAYWLATVDDIAHFKQENKIIQQLKLYKYCTKEVIELLAHLQMYHAKSIAEKQLQPDTK